MQARRDRDDARRALAAIPTGTEPPTREQIVALVTDTAVVAERIAQAAPAQRRKLYGAMGLRIAGR